MEETKEKMIDFLLRYRAILAEGRVKPDREGRQPYIRESLEGVGIIHKIDTKLTKYLKLEEDDI